MSLCGTTITYRGIIFKSVLSQDIQTETVYNSFGNVDQVATKYRITWVSSIHTADTWCHGYRLAVSTGNDVLAPALRLMIEEFLKPRGRFTMSFGDGVFIDVVPFASEWCNNQVSGQNWPDFDVAHGPRTTFKVLAVQGTAAVKAQMSVEFVVPPRCKPQGGTKEWLNLRYVVDEDIDCPAGFIRTRTYRGVFRVKGINPSDSDVHFLARQIAVPPLQRGFQRQNIRIAPTDNELECAFTFVDKEVKSQAPAPAHDWEGDFTLDFAKGEIATTSTLRFSLRGAPEIPKPQLFNLAYRIIETKLNYKSRRGPIDDPSKPLVGTIFLTNASFSESLKDNKVSAQVSIRNMDQESYLTNLRMNGNAGSTMLLGVDLPANVGDGTAWAYPQYDPLTMFKVPKSFSDLSSILLCALQNPCCPEQLTTVPVVDRKDLEYQTYEESEERDEPETRTTDYDDKYSKEHYRRMHQWYKLSSEHLGDTGWRGTPRGVQCTTSTDNATMAFAQIHCPVACRKIRIHAARINEWPQLPRIENWRDRNGILHVLGPHRVEPSPPALSADALDALFEVYAEYYYYLERPPSVSQSTTDKGILTGMLPYTTNKVITVAKSAMSKDAFVDPKQILDEGFNE